MKHINQFIYESANEGMTMLTKVDDIVTGTSQIGIPAIMDGTNMSMDWLEDELDAKMMKTSNCYAVNINNICYLVKYSTSSNILSVTNAGKWGDETEDAFYEPYKNGDCKDFIKAVKNLFKESNAENGTKFAISLLDEGNKCTLKFYIKES